MGNYNLPTNSFLLIGLGGKMSVGMLELSVPLGLTLITTAQMQANVGAFTIEDQAFNTGRSVQLAASGLYQAEGAALYDWLLGVSNTLATKWGTRWSTQWAQAGFINNTTSIPPKIEDRLGLALALVSFYTAQPGYEVASLDQTAAYGTTLRAAVLSTQAAYTATTVSLKTISGDWQAVYDTLVAGMRSLIKNLSEKLDNNDPRWLTFGLQMPSTISTPGKPVNVAASSGGLGNIIVTCDAVPLATRYRVRMIIVGVDTAYKLVGSSAEPIVAISGVDPGTMVQLIIQAVNNNLQGVASDMVQYLVPLPVQKPTLPKNGIPPLKNTEVFGLPDAHGNGHRESNGNGNGHREGNGKSNGSTPRLV